MSDGPLGARVVELDITGTIGARVIRAFPQVVKIKRIHITGTAPAVGEGGDLVLREGSASGPIIWSLRPMDSERVNRSFDVDIICNGLYMDSATAWTQLPATGTADMFINTA